MIKCELIVEELLFIHLRLFFPWAKNDSVSHDSYNCKSFNFTQPWPTKRKMKPANFVGAIFLNGPILDKICPEECRPKDHKDWKYC